MNRETYLNKAIDNHFIEWFSNAGVDHIARSCGGKSLKEIRSKIRVSCGFPAGVRGTSANKTIGVCWNEGCSSDNSIEIFISPIIDDSSRVLDILIHELIHAVLPTGEGHGKNFRKAALKIGLTGKMTATTASPTLINDLKKVIAKIGTYPHGKMDINNRKKQTTRMIKHECFDCNSVWRMSKKYTPESCPCCQSKHICSHWM